MVHQKFINSLKQVDFLSIEFASISWNVDIYPFKDEVEYISAKKIWSVLYKFLNNPT